MSQLSVLLFLSSDSEAAPCAARVLGGTSAAPLSCADNDAFEPPMPSAQPDTDTIAAAAAAIPQPRRIKPVIVPLRDKVPPHRRAGCGRSAVPTIRGGGLFRGHRGGAAERRPARYVTPLASVCSSCRVPAAKLQVSPGP